MLKVTEDHRGHGPRRWTRPRDDLRARVIADKASDLIYDRANKTDDLLSGGVALDNLPGDLGLVAVTGTLDAQGYTPACQPPPIPGDDRLRKALIPAAFQMKPGDPPHLAQAPPGGRHPGLLRGHRGRHHPARAENPTPTCRTACRPTGRTTPSATKQEETAARILGCGEGRRVPVDPPLLLDCRCSTCRRPAAPPPHHSACRSSSSLRCSA